MSTALLYERTDHPDERYGADGFESWRTAMTARLQSLGSALDASDAKIFTDDLQWFRGITVSRGIPAADFDLAIQCLEESVRDQLPEGAGATVDSYFAAAKEALSGEAAPEPALSPRSGAGELFELALVGDLGGARRYLIDAVGSGRFTVQEAIIDVLLPAAREAGRRWHLGQLGVAAEHVITASLRSALHSLTAALPRPEPNGKAVFIAAVPGDAHDTGLVAFALLLEQEGWRIALAGADTPTEEVDVTAEGYHCDLIALSATLPSQRYALSSFLTHRTGTLPVLVGGAAVKDRADALNMGAEGYARDLADGVLEARRIVELDD